MPVRVFNEEEKEKLRRKMLEEGFPLLKQYGVTHMSVSKITDAAGIGTSTFYNFWKSKEEYLADLIFYHRQKMLPVLIPEDVRLGKRKLGREDAKRYLYAVVDKEISIYPHLTLEDEAKIFRNTDEFKPDIEKETAITAGLLQHLEGVRSDVNFGVVANLSKILVITAESREELHESAYDATLEALIEAILNQIFVKRGLK